MASARYAPLPNSRAEPDAEREMDEAFGMEDDDEQASEHGETTPLTVKSSTPPDGSHDVSTAQGNGIYDFERDYDYPPPGSPPDPSSRALPNSFGNSNGYLPTSPVAPSVPRPSFFRRAVGTLLPSYYQRVPIEDVRVRRRGGGIENDGVFANVMAKPGAGRNISVRTANGDIYMVPEETQSEVPPSYAAAQADAAPAYWETTVHAPSTNELNGDMIIDDLPTGPFLTFLFTAVISWFFQLPGFLLTYLLHRTHAAKFGSLAGLSLTLIQLGFGSTFTGGADLPQWGEGSAGSGQELEVPVTDVNGAPTTTMTIDMPYPTGMPMPTGESAPFPDMPQAYVPREWISFILMTMGWFLLLTSIIGFFRVKRFEMSVRAAAASAHGPQTTAEDVQREMAIRRNFDDVFGINLGGAPGQPAPPVAGSTQGLEGQTINLVETVDLEQARRMIEEARLERDLRAAGLL
ncbi:hypothetical protein EW146_g6310 [Bondarzewia mesenterica]|uniref:Uncharacterized protein n=1 Tax=Bondarzewia mesenterica TaxID=1095465 RepID=A0A4S4LPJ3_9AGAM|nr:hypothetical protein EW146_g6310 [Bondarzewia mesenterica]